MTQVAEIRRLDDAFEVQPLARLLAVPGGIEVVELQPNGAALARSMMDDPLFDPYDKPVTQADGAAFLRALRWCYYGDRLWITPVAELPDELARDPDVPLRFEAVPYVPATVPYPEVPEALSEVRVVQVVRPAPEDYLQREVLARVVAVPGAPVRLEGADPVTRRQIEELLDVLGPPPVHERDYAALAPGIVAIRLSFDRPGDSSWRNGLARAHRAARTTGDRAAVARLDLEFSTLLPRVWLSRCPFSGQVLRLAFDGWGFDSPYWDPAAPVRPDGDKLPSRFLGLAGAVVDGAGDVPPEAAGAGRAPVFPAVLADPDVRAVVSAVHVGSHRCDVVAYFTRSRSPAPPVLREWGTRRARVPDRSGWRWIPAPDPDPPAAVDLAPWLHSEQLQWIEPFDQGVALRSGTDGCPWLG